MNDLVSRALDTAARSAQYADVRLVETSQERFVVRNGVVDTLSMDESLGIGVRVLVNGAWGFASSNLLSPAEADRVAVTAVAVAKASASLSAGPVELGPPVTSRGVYTTPVKIDPFTISPEAKLALLFEADAAMAPVQGLSARQSNLIFIRERKTFSNSEGAMVEQTIFESGGGIQATAVGEGEVQRRSYPQSFGRQQGCAGWEYVLDMELAKNAERTATEAVSLLTADRCPSDVTTTIIIGGSQLGLQIHESCGHAIELDRVMGSEAAYAGTSFLTTDKLHDFQYGSEQVNITADSVRTPGLGSFGWDDEGVPAPVHSHYRRRAVCRVPDVAGNGLLPGHGLQRDDAGRIMEPDTPDPHDQRQPGARNLGTRGPDRRYRRRHFHGLEPVLVHRRPPLQLPVRNGSGLRNQKRQSWGGCCATAPIPGSPRSSGGPATPCATTSIGTCGVPPTAARGNRANWDTPDTARRQPASATSAWGCCDDRGRTGAGPAG